MQNANIIEARIKLILLIDKSKGVKYNLRNLEISDCYTEPHHYKFSFFFIAIDERNWVSSVFVKQVLNGKILIVSIKTVQENAKSRLFVVQADWKRSKNSPAVKSRQFG